MLPRYNCLNILLEKVLQKICFEALKWWRHHLSHVVITKILSAYFRSLWGCWPCSSRRLSKQIYDRMKICFPIRHVIAAKGDPSTFISLFRFFMFLGSFDICLTCLKLHFPKIMGFTPQVSDNSTGRGSHPTVRCLTPWRNYITLAVQRSYDLVLTELAYEACEENSSKQQPRVWHKGLHFWFVVSGECR